MTKEEYSHGCYRIQHFAAGFISVGRSSENTISYLPFDSNGVRRSGTPASSASQVPQVINLIFLLHTFRSVWSPRIQPVIGPRPIFRTSP